MELERKDDPIGRDQVETLRQEIARIGVEGTVIGEPKDDHSAVELFIPGEGVRERQWGSIIDAALSAVGMQDGETYTHEFSGAVDAEAFRVFTKKRMRLDPTNDSELPR